jgi:uncharacterized protein HemX
MSNSSCTPQQQYPTCPYAVDGHNSAAPAALAALVAPAAAAAAGEYISVSSQKDAEEADIEKERAEQRKGPEAQERELDELTQIYIDVRGGSENGLTALP